MPSWVAGVAVALLTWPVGIGAPGAGLDASWNAGLAMAVHDGLAFGREVVFSYGPLGFLQGQFVWYGDLAALALLFSSALYLAFSTALVWALRRSLPLLLSVVIAFAVLTFLPLLDQPLLVAAIASLALLEKERPPRFVWAFAVLAASFAAVEALIKLSTGPVILVVFALALLGARAGRVVLVAFSALFSVELLALWLATGQSIAALPDFAASSWQVISGYSTAMLRDADVPAWKVTAATIAAALITIGLVAGSLFAGFRDTRARRFGAAVVAVAAFILFKEGVVRTDAGHLSLYFSSACVLWIALPWTRSRWPALLALAAVIALAGMPVRPPGLEPRLDAVANLRFAVDQARNLLGPSRRAEAEAVGRTDLRGLYALDPHMLAQLRGRRVAVEPWEVAAAWAYDLDWQPLPVFQNYTAYTSELDHLNAVMIEDPAGPERILRENPLLVFPEFETAGLDNRQPSWDPPAQARAVLCNFAPLASDERWQVLGRVPNRCGPAHALDSVEAGEGEAVRVPAPPPGEFVFVRIEGAQVSGVERLGTMLVHARVRRIVVDGANTYRLVPETARNGLLLRGDPRIAAELGSFSPIPQARTIAVEGAGGDLRYDFYATPLSGLAPRRSPG